MSRTRKTDVARSLHSSDITRDTSEVAIKPKRHKRGLKLINTGQRYMSGKPVHVDTGGVRYGNKRLMKAGLKASKRRSERRENNEIPKGE